MLLTNPMTIGELSPFKKCGTGDNAADESNGIMHAPNYRRIV
jgi:hypothetical protein